MYQLTYASIGQSFALSIVPMFKTSGFLHADPGHVIIDLFKPGNKAAPPCFSLPALVRNDHMG